MPTTPPRVVVERSAALALGMALLVRGQVLYAQRHLEQYRELVRQGGAAAAAGRHQEALQFYLQARANEPEVPADLHGAIAQEQLLLNDFGAGLTNALACVRAAEAAGPSQAELRARCVRLLDVLAQGRVGPLGVDTGMGLLTVQLASDAAEGTQVLVATRALPRTLWNQPVPVEAGAVVVELREPGGTSLRRVSQVARGVPASLALSANEVRRADGAQRGRPALRITGGVGLGLAGGALVLGVLSFALREGTIAHWNSSACDMPGMTVMQACPGDPPIFNTTLPLGIAGFVGAGVLTVPSVALLAVGAPPRSEGARRARAACVPWPNGAGVTCVGSF